MNNPSAPIAMEILRFLTQIVMESGNCNSKYKRTIRSKRKEIFIYITSDFGFYFKHATFARQQQTTLLNEYNNDNQF